ncbi:MAG TPA: RNA polymerase sigma factor [Polyangiales bacterium]|nr:RNA polymerase sigma factor [Polyangiales bacterium]
MGARSEDAELLAAWAEGDGDAGSELIERHFAAVHRFFSNKVDRDLDDLVQQTFLACLEARARFEQRSSFPVFLLGIARHLLYDFYRKRRREPLEFSAASVRDFGTSPSQQVARREEETLLNEALRRIPLESQVILELTYWEGFSGAELASVMDAPLGTIYSRLHRARESVLEQLVALMPERAIDIEGLFQAARSPGTLSAKRSRQ